MSESFSAEDYPDLFEHAPAGYLTMAPDGRISKVNATFAIWTGVPSENLIGQRLHRFLNRRAYLLRNTHCTVASDVDFETATGERLPFIANGVERRDADGKVLFTAIVVLKATDRRRSERELVESRSELQKGLATQHETAVLREQFIAVLGHDLRNPLAAIKCRRADSAAVRRPARATERSFASFYLMNATVNRMSDLIDDVLDFARARLGSGITLH